MNKLMILILAMCLISVHAFVKRDAPATDNAAGDVLESAKKAIEEGWKKFNENVNADTIKKGFSDTIDNINKAISDLKPAEAPKP